jgi:hypothetical protein
MTRVTLVHALSTQPSIRTRAKRGEIRRSRDTSFTGTCCPYRKCSHSRSGCLGNRDHWYTRRDCKRCPSTRSCCRLPATGTSPPRPRRAPTCPRREFGCRNIRSCRSGRDSRARRPRRKLRIEGRRRSSRQSNTARPWRSTSSSSNHSSRPGTPDRSYSTTLPAIRTRLRRRRPPSSCTTKRWFPAPTTSCLPRST